jgi:hypothetical protein
LAKSLFGGGIAKGSKDPSILPDESYPSWLWELDKQLPSIEVGTWGELLDEIRT